MWWRRSLALFAVALSSVAMAKIKPSVIYGDDNRIDYYEINDTQTRQRANATVALMRASTLSRNGNVTNISTVSYGEEASLCPDEPFYHQETAAFCSGFLLAPDIIVSAGHCIRDQVTCDNTKFVFGFRLETTTSQPRSVPSDDVFSCKKLLHSVAEPNGEDFSVVRLDRPVARVSPLSYRKSGKPAVGAPLMVMGHPSGLPLKIADGANVRAVQPTFLTANLDTYGGNSGSAVFNSATGLVEGVLVRGEMDFKVQNGCRSSNRCPNTGCRGEDVTLIQQVLPYLPH